MIWKLPEKLGRTKLKPLFGQLWSPFSRLKGKSLSQILFISFFQSSFMGKDKKSWKNRCRTSSTRAPKWGGKNPKNGSPFPTVQLFFNFFPHVQTPPQGVKNALGVGFLPNTQWSGGCRAGFFRLKMRGVHPGPQGCPRAEPFWGFNTYPKGRWKA